MGIIDESPGTEARHLIRRHGTAALGTASASSDDWPYASLVVSASDYDGAPLLLISTLAEHTANIGHDSRVSLLFFDQIEDGEDPLTRSRVTVVGRARLTEAPHHRRRYLARHPDAAGYADFADFSFFRVEVERAHLVAGFGRITWIEGVDLLLSTDTAAPFAEAEAGIVEHMNADHKDAVELYATNLLGAQPGDWKVTGCDPDGLDLTETGKGAYARLVFDQPIETPSDVRPVLLDLVQRARNP